jgi:hypothetical protein
VASRNIAAEPPFLPNSHNSSTSTKPAFCPPTTPLSAEMTFSSASVVRWRIVRWWSMSWSSASSSGSARTIAAAGSKLLCATSIVGARISSSASWRQFLISAVSMMPAAIVDL